MKLLIGLFPRRWRERYGEEIADDLAHSSRPGRDRLDLLLALAPIWADDTRRLAMRPMLIWTRALGAVFATVGGAMTLWATSELEGGVTALPRHWWSTAAVLLPLAAATAVAGFGELVARRRGR
ncbi:MAG TPA: hypothetical protein VIX41_11540 [Acidimicrobiales bacterium]